MNRGAIIMMVDATSSPEAKFLLLMSQNKSGKIRNQEEKSEIIPPDQFDDAGCREKTYTF
jgi:hypothetical protein